MRPSPAVLAALLALALAGCGGDDGGDGDGGEAELVVFAASSLEPAFEEYAAEFADAEVAFSFAGSDDLAAQIRQGVVPDVYAAADTALPRELANEGLLHEPRVFATNLLVIGVPRGSGIDSIDDLTEPGTAIAIAEEGVPAGDYTRETLAALDEPTEEAILDNVASEEPDVGGVVAKLTQGAVDAGFVYRTDAFASNGRIEPVPIPRSARPDVEYAIAVTEGAEQPAAAQRFVDGVLFLDGRRLLIRNGFGPPPPGS